MTPDAPARPRLRLQLAAFTATRTVLNTGYRMVYPFLPAIARGLGVDLATVAQAVTARALLGLLAPLYGSLADRRGRQQAMLIGLGIFAAGLVSVALLPGLPTLFAALILGAAGKGIFETALLAYLSDQVVYEQRGRVLALTEIAWSASFLFGIPLVGWLIGRTDWRAPFPWIAGLALGSALLVWRSVPPDPPHPDSRPTLAGGLRLVMSHPGALAAMSVSLLMSLANETVNIVYGAWMEQTFALKVAALGAASAVIGVAELGGEGLVVGVVDGLGKRRSVALGLLLNAAACLALPFLSASLPGALAGLFVFYITFEFALVSSIPLVSELMPDTRATMMAANVAAILVGRAVGALLGPALFSMGLIANVSAAAVCDLATVAVLLLLVRQQ